MCNVDVVFFIEFVIFAGCLSQGFSFWNSLSDSASSAFNSLFLPLMESRSTENFNKIGIQFLLPRS